MKIGSKTFDIGAKTFIVGILNVTPDSFSDGGIHLTVNDAVSFAKKLVRDGADIIEIGGESTRPGHSPIDAAEELRRVLPVLKELVNAIDIPIAVDTCKAPVAESVLQNGASLINDVWGFKKDPMLARVCAKYNAACCIMHNRDNMDYPDDFLPDVILDLKESIDIAVHAGIKPEKIIIDPGIGFAKSVEQNFSILRSILTINALNYPILIGASRKSFIGYTADLPIHQRDEATIAITALAISQGCDFIRVHNVLSNKRAAIIADKIIRDR